MNICHISDTHGFHDRIDWSKMEIPLEEIDVLIHSGDFTNYGNHLDVISFTNWFKRIPVKNKILIAGNHDRSFDVKYSKEYSGDTGIEPVWLTKLMESHKDSFHYLEDSCVTIDGYKFFGSPHTPWFYGQRWAFNIQRGEDMKQHWAKIPDDVDVVITHGPPAGFLDCTNSNEFVGCEDLLNRIKSLPKLKAVCFGHIHESYGLIIRNYVIYSNASIWEYDTQHNSIRAQHIIKTPNTFMI